MSKSIKAEKVFGISVQIVGFKSTPAAILRKKSCPGRLLAGTVGDAVQMTLNANTTGPAARQSPWLGIVKLLFIVILIAIIFLLGQDMVRHRFFGGGWVDQHDVLRP